MMVAEDYVDVGIGGGGGGGSATDASATNNSNDKDEETPLVTTSEMRLESSPSVGPFRSTFTSKDSKIQGILRSITWSDPFYEHPTTYTGCGGGGTDAGDEIIAVFDINAKQLRGAFEVKCILLGFALFIAFLMTLIPTEEDFYWNIVLSTYCIALIVAMIEFQLVMSLLKELHMIGRRHVAVTTRGIYLDAATDVHTHQVAQRRIIAYDTINACTVDEMGIIQPVFQVSIGLNRFDASGLGGLHTRISLSSGQAFVDLVNALMDQAKITASQGADATAVAPTKEHV